MYKRLEDFYEVIIFDLYCFKLIEYRLQLNQLKFYENFQNLEMLKEHNPLLINITHQSDFFLLIISCKF